VLRTDRCNVQDVGLAARTRAIRVGSTLLSAGVAAWGPLGVTTVGAQQTERAANVDAIFSSYTSPQSAGCVVGVIQDGKLVHGRGYGMADLDNRLPLSTRTVMNVASMAKQFTAASIVLLVADGALSLDDDVRKFVPELPDYGSKVTVRHLVHHTSGVRNYFGLMGLKRTSFDIVQTDSDRLSLIARQRALNFVPGSDHEYSNSNFFLLSQIVRKATGKSLRAFADERLFRPLGMTNTHFHDDRHMTVSNRAASYGMGPAGVRRADFVNFEGVGDVGLMTTVEDLARWDRNFYDNRLGRGFVDTLLTRGRLTSGAQLDYAFGLYHGKYRGVATIGHGGAFMGFGSYMLRFPEARFTSIVLCNISNANAERLAQQVADIYLAERLTEAAPIAAPPSAPPRFAPPASVPLERERIADFAGRYQSDELDMMMEFAVADGGLVARRSGDPDRGHFYLGDDAFGVPGPGGMFRLQFRRNPQGIVEGFVLDAGRVRGVWFSRIP